VRAARLAAAEAAAVSAGPRAAGLAAALPAPVRAALSGWVLPLAATVAAFPLVDAAAARAHALFPIVDAAADALAAGGGGGGGGSTGAGLLEAAIAAGDPATSGLYFAVVALCAPLWEEAIFRGVLLPSLAATLRPPAAVAASALVFALAHFSVPRFVPLLLLGGLFGALFVHTRSLGTAVAAHALWNVYIFAHLLTAAGGGG
jgi:membrane protease YdiL (CAAX protease family)